MKKLLVLSLCALFGLSLASCTPDENKQSSTDKSSQTTQIINYSNNPYVGLAGSTYKITQGTSEDFLVIMFWFYADGSGAYGFNRNGETEVIQFHYDISGEVNVTWVRDDNNKWGSGYFTTLSSTGQCFVTEGIYLNRIS